MFDFLLITETLLDAALFMLLLASPFALYSLAATLYNKRKQRRMAELRQSQKRAYVEDLFRQIG